LEFHPSKHAQRPRALARRERAAHRLLADDHNGLRPDRRIVVTGHRMVVPIAGDEDVVVLMGDKRAEMCLEQARCLGVGEPMLSVMFVSCLKDAEHGDA
jgi:hypothetical protein